MVQGIFGVLLVEETSVYKELFFNFVDEIVFLLVFIHNFNLYVLLEDVAGLG